MPNSNAPSPHGTSTTQYQLLKYSVRTNIHFAYLSTQSVCNVDTQHQLGLQNGALIACPIPGQYEAAGASIQKAVEQAVAESEANGVNKLGKAATPWLLMRIGELTKGESLASSEFNGRR